MKSTKKVDHILEMPGLKDYDANYFKDQWRPSSRFATVMFHGTPCRCLYEFLCHINLQLQVI